MSAILTNRRLVSCSRLSASYGKSASIQL